MNPEDIIPEIHRHRENLARACGYNVKKLMDHYRKREAGNQAKGHRLVSFVESRRRETTSYALREEPARKKK
jgi:hypothetical protein